jgi:integrase
VEFDYGLPRGELEHLHLIRRRDAGEQGLSHVIDLVSGVAAADLIPDAGEDGKYESARQHGMHALRHFYASVLLDAGESIKAVSQYLGHTDLALTSRVYPHLMPSSQERTRRTIDAILHSKLASGGQSAS